MLHAWGMTEMSPLGTVCTLKAKHADLPKRPTRDQGQAGPCHLRRRYQDRRRRGSDLPWDGKAFGDLQVRGPWIASGYFKGEGGDPLARTAGSRPATSPPSTPTAIMQITDRSKDVIKSGGEWISSIELENIADRRIRPWPRRR